MPGPRSNPPKSLVGSKPSQQSRRKNINTKPSATDKIPPPSENSPELENQPQPSKRPRSQSPSTSHKKSQPQPSSLDITPYLAHLPSTQYAILPLSVISSTSIEKRVTRTLEHLASYTAAPPTLPGVVVLYAKAGVASKLITVAEIVKREIGKKEDNGKGGVWYQYIIVDSLLGEVERRDGVSAETGKGRVGQKNKESRKESGEGDDEDVDMDEGAQSDGSEEVFETMKTPFERAIEGTPKVRGVPVMVMYLSRVKINALRKLCGEETNAV